MDSVAHTLVAKGRPRVPTCCLFVFVCFLFLLLMPQENTTDFYIESTLHRTTSGTRSKWQRQQQQQFIFSFLSAALRLLFFPFEAGIDSLDAGGRKYGKSYSGVVGGSSTAPFQ